MAHPGVVSCADDANLNRLYAHMTPLLYETHLPQYVVSWCELIIGEERSRVNDKF
jgi:hypothetical protein